MAIEIRELVIKATVNAADRNNRAQVDKRDLRQMKREIMQECMEVLMAKLEERKER